MHVFENYIVFVKCFFPKSVTYFVFRSISMCGYLTTKTTMVYCTTIWAEVWWVFLGGFFLQRDNYCPDMHNKLLLIIYFGRHHHIYKVSFRLVWFNFKMHKLCYSYSWHHTTLVPSTHEHFENAIDPDLVWKHWWFHFNLDRLKC